MNPLRRLVQQSPHRGSKPTLQRSFGLLVVYQLGKEQHDRTAALILTQMGSPDMIMRVYRCTVVAGREAGFREIAFATGHAWLRKQSGLLAFYAGRSLPGSDGRARCMVQIWESMDAIRTAFGEDWQHPRKLPDELRPLVESESVEHYDIADEFHSEA